MAAVFHLLLIALLFSTVGGNEIESSSNKFPLVISTWPFLEAVRAGWKAINDGLSSIDSVVEGCSACEVLRCDGTVGPGGSPDENSETTIDALIMNGATMEVGAVAAMRYVKDGIKAARLVMLYTEHTMLAGDQASAFAISMGLSGPSNLSSTESMEKWSKWKENRCQPNFRKNVIPINRCGPYHRRKDVNLDQKICLVEKIAKKDVIIKSSFVDLHNHDTISMAIFDKSGHIAVGTSTNGASFKIPGSVGLAMDRLLDLLHMPMMKLELVVQPVMVIL